MRNKIENHVNFHGLTVRVDKFLSLWADYAGNHIEQMPFKRDLRYWNDGPTAMKPKGTFACYRGSKDNCFGVFEIWERADGFLMEVYKFDTLEDYNDYNPSGESPDAIKREIGLCENYHTGI